jgi:hypothetical protein
VVQNDQKNRFSGCKLQYIDILQIAYFSRKLRKTFFKTSRDANPGLISFSQFSRKVSNFEYMLLHKLYINMAIAVVFS